MRTTLTMIILAINIVEKEWGDKTSLSASFPEDSAPVAALCCIVELLRLHSTWNQLPSNMRIQLTNLCYKLLPVLSRTCRSDVDFRAKENTSGFVTARISVWMYTQHLQRFEKSQDIPIDIGEPGIIDPSNKI